MSLRVVVLEVSVSLASRWHRKHSHMLPPSITQVLTALLVLSIPLMGPLPLKRGNPWSAPFPFLPSHKARVPLLCWNSQFKCQFIRISCTIEVSFAQLYQASEQKTDISKYRDREAQWWGLGQPKLWSTMGITVVCFVWLLGVVAFTNFLGLLGVQVCTSLLYSVPDSFPDQAGQLKTLLSFWTPLR